MAERRTWTGESNLVPWMIEATAPVRRRPASVPTLSVDGVGRRMSVSVMFEVPFEDALHWDRHMRACRPLGYGSPSSRLTYGFRCAYADGGMTRRFECVMGWSYDSPEDDGRVITLDDIIADLEPVTESVARRHRDREGELSYPLQAMSDMFRTLAEDRADMDALCGMVGMMETMSVVRDALCRMDLLMLEGMVPVVTLESKRAGRLLEDAVDRIVGMRLETWSDVPRDEWPSWLRLEDLFGRMGQRPHRAGGERG